MAFPSHGTTRYHSREFAGRDSAHLVRSQPDYQPRDDFVWSDGNHGGPAIRRVRSEFPGPSNGAYVEATERAFSLPANHYWAGGRLDIIEIYHSWFL